MGLNFLSTGWSIEWNDCSKTSIEGYRARWRGVPIRLERYGKKWKPFINGDELPAVNGLKRAKAIARLYAESAAR